MLGSSVSLRPRVARRWTRWLGDVVVSCERHFYRGVPNEIRLHKRFDRKQTFVGMVWRMSESEQSEQHAQKGHWRSLLEALGMPVPEEPEAAPEEESMLASEAALPADAGAEAAAEPMVESQPERRVRSTSVRRAIGMRWQTSLVLKLSLLLLRSRRWSNQLWPKKRPPPKPR